MVCVARRAWRNSLGAKSELSEKRVDRTTLAEYVAWRRTSCEVPALGYDLQALRDALKLIAPSTDWSWLLNVAKRMTAAAPA
jgi:hypothetical protein